MIDLLLLYKNNKEVVTDIAVLERKVQLRYLIKETMKSHLMKVKVKDQIIMEIVKEIDVTLRS
jgi:hypothetical protein